MQQGIVICFIILRNRQLGVCVKPRRARLILINHPERKRFCLFSAKSKADSAKKILLRYFYGWGIIVLQAATGSLQDGQLETGGQRGRFYLIKSNRKKDITA